LNREFSEFPAVSAASDVNSARNSRAFRANSLLGTEQGFGRAGTANASGGAGNSAGNSTTRIGFVDSIGQGCGTIGRRTRRNQRRRAATCHADAFAGIRCAADVAT
jgi:hypothetical protein